MRKILHITSHMGGGAGKAISDTILFDKNNLHTLILLEQPQKLSSLDKLSGKCKIYQVGHYNLEVEISKSDIVILHWWNHPAMAKLILDFPKISSYYLLWCHISGCTYPFLPFSFLNKFHHILFTSPCSYDNEKWIESEKKWIKENSSIVYGLGNLQITEEKEDYTIESEQYVIGYVGTFTRSKIDNNFIKLCKRIIERIPNVKFVMIGDKEAASWMYQEPDFFLVKNHIQFLGYVNQVQKKLKEFDVFAYPLNSFHFGTTENAILEAMAVGLPVLCMNQATEKYIIENEHNGILANSMEDYVNKIVQLYQDRELAKRIGNRAKIDVKNKYSIEKNIQNLNKALEIAGQLQPNIVSFEYDTVQEYFMSFIKEDEKPYFICATENNWDYLQQKMPIFCEENKSSLLHFYRYFPENNWLMQWNKINRKEKIMREPQVFDCFNADDNRGYFTKPFSKGQYEKWGIADVDWAETYYTFSHKDVLRGMHFQVPPMDHEKLVHVVSGSLLDVVVDLRKDSANYGKAQSFLLKADKPQILFIPKGFAHGYLSLEDNTVTLYHVTTVHSGECDQGISYDSIDFDWKIANPILSERDKNQPSFQDFQSPF